MQQNQDKEYLANFIGNYATPSTSWMLMSSSGRLGAALSNLSLVLLIFGAALFLAVLMSGLVTGLIAIFIAIIVIFVIIFTLGLALLALPDEMKKLLSVTEMMGDITVWLNNFALRVAPGALIASVVFAAVSIVFLALDRSRKHIGRIAFSSVVVVISVIVAVASAIEGGAA